MFGRTASTEGSRFCALLVTKASFPSIPKNFCRVSFSPRKKLCGAETVQKVFSLLLMFESLLERVNIIPTSVKGCKFSVKSFHWCDLNIRGDAPSGKMGEIELCIGETPFGGHRKPVRLLPMTTKLTF